MFKIYKCRNAVSNIVSSLAHRHAKNVQCQHFTLATGLQINMIIVICNVLQIAPSLPFLLQRCIDISMCPPKCLLDCQCKKKTLYLSSVSIWQWSTNTLTAMPTSCSDWPDVLSFNKRIWFELPAQASFFFLHTITSFITCVYK